MNNGLTPREEEVVSLLSDGLSTKQMARKLFLSRMTIQRHVDNLLERYELTNRAHIVSYALRNEMIK